MKTHSTQTCCILAAALLALLTCSTSNLNAQGRGAGFWQTNGKLILDANGQPVRIAGVNWFGLETSTFAPHGLWARSYKEMLAQIKSLGYNTIRLPYSNQLFDADSIPNGIDLTLNPDLKGLGGLEIMDRIVQYCGQVGLKILLDRHRPDANGQSALWYTNNYSEARWISDWQMLADRYKTDPTIIGADLHNEPRQPSCWGCGSLDLDWRLAAQRAGNAIHQKNSNWLIIVEGVDIYDNSSYWWGGNLKGVANAPVILKVANRVVYSAHDYPSSLFAQTWFSASNYPKNLPGVWDSYWGYILKKEIAPVVMGEFGSRLETDSDQLWFTSLINYMGDTVEGVNWFFWSWNPNSVDTHGLLLDDWLTVDQRKQAALKQIQFPLNPGTTAAPVTPTTPDPTTTPDTPTTTPTTPTTDPAPTVPTTPSGDSVPGVFCKATLKIWSDWGTGTNAEFGITNVGAGPIEGWTVSWTFAGNQKVRELWNGRVNQVGQQVVVTNTDWNNKMPQGSSVNFGFIADYQGENVSPTQVMLNGFTCALEVQ